MKSKLLSVLILMGLLSIFIYQFGGSNSPYTLTYQRVKDTPQVIGIDKDFNLSYRAKDSMHKMSNRITSLKSGDVLSSSNYANLKYDLCVNDDCVDFADDYGASYFIYTSLTDDINVRSNGNQVELLRVSDMKKLILEGFIGSGGVSSSSSYYFTKTIGDQYQVIEVDKDSFEVVKVYDTSASLTPVIVEDSLYFYQTDKGYLQVYDEVNKSYSDSMIVNNVIYQDGIYNIEEIYIGDKQYYMLDVNGYEVVITDFKDKVIINNADYNTYGYPVCFRSESGNTMVMILGNKQGDDKVYYEFYQVNNDLSTELINSGSTKYNIGIDPQIATKRD